ncbi:MAG: lytic transglycosylase domain-containing protein [Gammaproteobacteria bacterium]
MLITNHTVSMLLLLALLATTCAVRADIYAFTDADGVRHFTNIAPADSRYKRIIRSRETEPGYRFPSTSHPAGRAMALASFPLRASAYDSVVRQAARAYQMDEALVRAVIHTESAYNPSAVSAKGASGLMQLMPGTATRYGVHDIFDPVENIYAGVHYLHDLKAMFNGNMQLTVAAYNAGEKAVLRYGGIPPYPETINYVSRVIDLHGRYSQGM